MLPRFALVFAGGLLSFNLVAEPAQSNDFSKAYQAYQAAVEAQNNELIPLHAKQSVDLGCNKFGEKSENCAALWSNYGYALGHDDDKAYEAANAFNSARLIFKELYGPDSIEVADTLIGAGQLTGLPNKKRIRYLQDAISIADIHDSTSPLYAANIYLEAGKELLRANSPKSKVLEKAYRILSQELANNDRRLFEARTTLANYYRADRKLEKSIELLELNIQQLEAVGAKDHPYDVHSRAQLVDLYERVGESDKATPHCVAIGAMTPWDPNQEASPLFRVPPKYPVNLARRQQGGQVVLDFEIDEMGFVDNVKIVRSTNKSLSRETTKALKNWRYAPKFEDGKPVRAESKVTIDFSIDER
ncbi:TonB family protein [Paraferrimonas sedimenticola]|uniref:Cell envelope biogenesis protein TonB n=1 Tax=Paraferrimonas sedimenticola TaxID=375674 RepID=A0AA37RNU2_9GAMM|nr:TonB family protein [Paraferrimonas sedimenticola]GLP94778.1 cell envelope biogenesis protein TonB [Paraferrimonas sedimenticola]